MADEQRRPNDLGENLREGVRTVAGIFGALKDAIEESFDDLRERGDLSPEKAREAARSTMERAQAEMDGMRDRFDFATRKELESLRAEVEALRAHVFGSASASASASGASTGDSSGTGNGNGTSTGTGARGSSDFPVDEA